MKKGLLLILTAVFSLSLCLTAFGGDGTNVKGDLPKLSTPVDLQWNIVAPLTSEGAGSEDPNFLYGATFFSVPGDYQGKYELKIYREGESEPVVNTSTDTGVWESQDGADLFFSDFEFLQSANELGSGTYYFTIKLLGDGIAYADSDIATSDKWTYTQPSEKLNTPVDLAWDYPNATCRFDGTPFGNTYYSYYYSDTDDTSSVKSSGGSAYQPMGENNPDAATSDGYFNSDYGYKQLQLHGTGFYYFKVRNLSFDITRYQNSDWSDFSAPYNLTTLVNDTNEAISGIDPNGSEAEIRSQLAGIGLQKLKGAMSADKDGSDTVGKIKQLEDKCGGQASVDVDSAVSDTFDKNDISVIGANLNGDGNAKLSFGSMVGSYDMLAEFRNSVKFSMDLTGDNIDPEKLTVPVELTIPVPDGINPDFMRIYHFKKSGAIETISPHIFEKDGKKYAKFVVTSFSDFAFVETAENKDNNKEENNNNGNNKEENNNNGNNKEENNNNGSNKEENGKSGENGENQGTGTPTPQITVSDNKPMNRTVAEKGSYKISYFQEIPFFGKSKIDAKYFNGITVSYNNAEYQVSKIKFNKKKGFLQITGLEGVTDKNIIKDIKKATKGENGLKIIVNPYYVREGVTLKKKKDGSVKSVKIMINGKDYKAKKGEWYYDGATKSINFKGTNLAGSVKAD